MVDAAKLRGFKWNPTGLYLSVFVNGTEAARFDDGTNDLRIINNGLQVDSGGITVTAGTIVSDDTTASTSTTTGSIHTDGGVGIVKDVCAGTARLVGKVTYADRLYHANAVTEALTGDKTLDNLDSGKIFTTAVDSAAITLPAMCDGTLRGCTYTIVNNAADGTAETIISPGSADKIMGPDIAGTDDLDYHLAKTTQKDGDYVTLQCDGTDGWWVIEQVGT